MYCVLVVFLPTSSYIFDPFPKNTHTHDNYKIITFINNFINIIHTIIPNRTSVMLVITHCKTYSAPGHINSHYQSRRGHPKTSSPAALAGIEDCHVGQQG